MQSALYEFAASNGYYLRNDYHYDYQGRKKSCMDTSSKNKITNNNIRPDGKMYMSVIKMLEYLQYQPLDIGINTPACVNFYKSGVITP